MTPNCENDAIISMTKMEEEIFEYVLEERLHFGEHQIRQFIILSLLDFLDGAEFFFLHLLAPSLQTEFDLTVSQLGLLSSAFNVGLMIGSIICGFAADKMGRKNILIIGTFLRTIIVYCIVLAPDIDQIIFLRFMYGLAMGLNVPISAIFMIEVTPKEHRGKTIVALQLIQLIGRIWLMGLGYIYMESISVGNWRAIVLLNSIPCILCLLGTVLWIQESPRYLILHDKMEEGLRNLNNIGNMNNGEYENINQQEMLLLVEWTAKQKEQHRSQANSIFQLFNFENLSITWRNYTLNFVFMFTLLVVYNIIPFILDDENKSLLHLFVVDIGEIPAVFIMIFSVDSFGRLSTLLISTGILVITLLSIWYWKLSIIVVGLIIYKFCCKINQGTYNLLFAESYHTFYRSLGLGTTNAIGRLAGSISPFVAFPIYFFSPYLAFLVCSITAFITFIILTTYPIDATQKPLDSSKRE